MVEHLGQQLTALIEELRTVADPDAAEAQIESVAIEAAAQVAAATARISRAEQAQRQAEAERLEADAAASEASTLAEQQHATLAVAQQELADRTHTLDQVTAELVAVRAAAAAQNAQAQAELSQLREQLATVRTRLGEAEHECDDANARTETASTAGPKQTNVRGARSPAPTTTRHERSAPRLASRKFGTKSTKHALSATPFGRNPARCAGIWPPQSSNATQRGRTSSVSELTVTSASVISAPRKTNSSPRSGTRLPSCGRKCVNSAAASVYAEAHPPLRKRTLPPRSQLRRARATHQCPRPEAVGDSGRTTPYCQQGLVSSVFFRPRRRGGRRRRFRG
jgi:ribosomal protein L29